MHIASSTFNQLAPSYHPTAQTYPDTITTQKKSCPSEDRALRKEQERTTRTAVNNLRRPFFVPDNNSRGKGVCLQCGSLSAPSSCPFCHARYLLGKYLRTIANKSLLLTFQEMDLVLFHFGHTRARLQRGFDSHNSMRAALNFPSSS